MSEIVSSVMGVVVSTGDAGDGFGESVIVKDTDGHTHRYGHLSAVAVRPGDEVAVGDVIATAREAR